MYKVIKIQRYQATRDVELLNQSTGTKDICFDDSAVVSFENFEFMQEGKAYDCKIELFGNFSKEKTDSNVMIKVINSDVIIGEKSMIEVQVNKDIYYIPRTKADEINIKGNLYFDFTRKDLIQVDNVIHSDML